MPDSGLNSGASQYVFVNVTLFVADGDEVQAQVFKPLNKSSGVVVIAPAMGVAQKFYKNIASWLAEQGKIVITFDYRGTGRSVRGNLRDCKVDVLDWAREDCSTVLAEAFSLAGESPVYWVGHSLGGQLFPLVENIEKVKRVVLIAAGNGYWLKNTSTTRNKAWWLWFFMVPLALRVFGYFPGRKLRKIGNLPVNVMKQWRSWCLNRDYALGVEGEILQQQFAAVKVPITSLAFTDDEMMSRWSVESLAGFFSGATVQLRHISPEQIQSSRIGHFGFFKQVFADSLWRDYFLPELN